MRRSGSYQQPMKITFREVVLYHFQNLSDESVGQGLKAEYEDALDRQMNWLYFEFVNHHGDDEVEAPDENGKMRTTTYRAAFFEVMNRGWGEHWEDHRKTRRCQHKEWLMSQLLSKHGIDLKSQVGSSIEDIDPKTFEGMELIGEDDGDDDGLSSTDSEDWQD